MKVWTHTEFSGHWPVGTAAVVVADTAAQALVLLERELTGMGLSQPLKESDFKELPVDVEKAVVLRDGEY